MKRQMPSPSARRYSIKYVLLAILCLAIIAGFGHSASKAPHEPTAAQKASTTVAQEASTTVIQETRTTVTHETSSTVTQAARPADSVLKRRNTPPAGVEPQFVWCGGGDGGPEPCPRGGTPSIIADTAIEEGPMVLDTFQLCFPGFAVHQPLTLEIRGPSGKRESLQINPDPRTATFEVILVFTPNDPLGNYALLARQGSAMHATINLKLRKLTIMPNARIVSGRSVTTWQPKFHRGDTILVALAGYKPGRTVALHLYRHDGAKLFVYSTTVKVRTDSDGEALYRLLTKRNDPKGKYMIVIPPVQGWHFFNVA
jgi:hypothetical protein